MKLLFKEEGHDGVTSAEAVESLINEESRRDFTSSTLSGFPNSMREVSLHYAMKYDDKDTLQPDLSPASTLSSRPTINHDQLNDPNTAARDVRSYMRQLEYKFPVTELRHKVKRCFQKVKKVRTQQQKRGCEKRYGVDVIISKFWLVDMTDPEFEQKTGLKSVLRLIRDPKQGFSKLAGKPAGKPVGILYKRFERQNWVLPDEEDDEALFSPEEPAEHELSVKRRHVNIVASTNESAFAMSRPSTTPNASLTKMKPDVQEDMKSSRRHAIYGRGNIMDGIWLRKHQYINQHCHPL